MPDASINISSPSPNARLGLSFSVDGWFTPDDESPHAVDYVIELWYQNSAMSAPVSANATITDTDNFLWHGELSAPEGDSGVLTAILRFATNGEMADQTQVSGLINAVDVAVRIPNPPTSNNLGGTTFEITVLGTCSPLPLYSPVCYLKDASLNILAVGTVVSNTNGSWEARLFTNSDPAGSNLSVVVELCGAGGEVTTDAYAIP